MLFEWDAEKNRSNRRKHGISFEEAVGVFGDPNRRITESYFDEETGEQRWIIIGRPAAETESVLLIVYVYRGNSNGEEIIRIISARKANKSERGSGEGF